MKVKKFLKALLGMSFLTLGMVTVNEVKEVNAAVTSPYNYTFTAKQFGGNETKSLGVVNWTLTNDGNFYGYDATKGQQIGSGNAPAKTITLSTSDIPGKITEVTINTSGAKSIAAKMILSVGGSQIGAQISLTKTATTYTFEPNTSGEIEFKWTQTSSKAIYFKSISVKFANVSAQYSVNYVTNCDTTIDSATINGGEKISEPTNLVKEGYTLEGWYTTSTFEESSKWSFDTSITDNVTLYAKWTNDDCENVSAINSYMDLAYKYSATINENTEVKTVTMTTNASVYTGAITLKNLAEVTNITSSFDNADCFEKIEFTKDGASNFYIKEKEMRLYSPGTVTLTEKEGVVIDSITPKIITDSDFGDASNITITNSGDVWTITADKKTKISGFEIAYTQTNAVTYSDAEFRLKFGIDKAVDDIMANLPKDAVYGLKITSGSDSLEAVSYTEIDNNDDNIVVFEREDDTCYYVVVSLGDVMNNINRATMKFSVQAYVISEGITYYSDVVKTYSVVDMVEAYYANDDTRVENLYNYFESKGLYA